MGFFGILIGLVLVPVTDSLGKPGDEIQYTLGGLILGCVVGVLWDVLTLASTENRKPILTQF